METSIETEAKELDEILKNTDLLVDESVQIYELESEKGNVIDELYNSLKTITEFLGFSVDLPTKIFNEEDDSKIILTPSLDIVIKRNNGKIEQKRLDEFSTKKIAEILKNSIMPIIDMCKNEKIIQNKNITFLKSITNKLDKIQAVNAEKITKDTSPHSMNQEKDMTQISNNPDADDITRLSKA